jgi:periplasmic protein CpxP/Spy
MISFNNNKWLSFLTLALLIANVVIISLLWVNHKKEANATLPPPPGPVFEFVIQQLSLDKPQQEKYKALREAHQQQQRPVLDSLAKARNAFLDLLKDPSVSDSVIALNSKRTLAFQQQIELINFKHFQQLRAICDTTQQRKFDDIIQAVLKRIAGQQPGGRRPQPNGNGEGKDRRTPGVEDGPPQDTPNP